MEDISIRLRKFIVKNLIGKVSFSEEKHAFQLDFSRVTEKERQIFRKEMRKYPRWKNESDGNIDRFCDDAISAVGLSYSTRTVAMPLLSLNDNDNLKVGYLVSLQCKDSKRGVARFRIMYLGCCKPHHRFYVVSSTMLALQPSDILETYDSSLWNVGFPIAFKVFRNGERIPRKRNLLYQTFPVSHITLELPSIVHEIVDARNDFTYEEYIAEKNANKKVLLSTYVSSMSLLMHEYSENMPLYADFQEDGKNAEIRVNADFKDFTENILSSFTECLTMKDLIKAESGKVRLDVTTDTIKVVEKIKLPHGKNN